MPMSPPGIPRGYQRWSTFLKNHAKAILACDFLVAVTAIFRMLYVFVVNRARDPSSILKAWVAHYNRGRPLQGAGAWCTGSSTGACGVSEVEIRHRSAAGVFVLAKSVLGGLHHEYSLATAPAGA